MISVASLDFEVLMGRARCAPLSCAELLKWGRYRFSVSSAVWELGRLEPQRGEYHGVKAQ